MQMQTLEAPPRDNEEGAQLVSNQANDSEEQQPSIGQVVDQIQHDMLGDSYRAMPQERAGNGNEVHYD